jgi:nucleotide-binding universal stress UspA family protein
MELGKQPHHDRAGSSERVQTDGDESTMTELPRYRTILFATDGSDQAAFAEGHALALALRTGARLEALYVVEPAMFIVYGFAWPTVDAHKSGHKVLDRLTQRAREAGVAVGTRLLEGRAGPTIIGEAERLGADLLVVGSRGHGALDDALLGSVSLYVLQHSQIPVCVIRPPRQSKAARAALEQRVAAPDRPSFGQG